MLFSKRKKLARDREAGLVFRWRSGTGTNRGGFTVAFLLTSAFFVMLFTLVNVRVKPNLLPSRYQASVIQLGMVEDNMAWWLEKKSPFLEPWYDDLESLAGGAVDAKLGAMIEHANAEPLQWRIPKFQQAELGLPNLFAKGEVEYPRPPKLNNLNQKVPDQEWQLLLSCHQPQPITRLPKRREYPLMPGLPEKWYGKSLQLVVQLDASGNVISTIPLHWSDDKTERLIETWMQSVRFTASKLEVEAVIVAVEVAVKKQESQKLEVNHD